MSILRLIEANAERWILAAILGALVVILAAQVIARYAFGAPLAWSEELARYLLIWCTFIGVSLAVREGRNISVDLLPTLMGPRGVRALAWLALLGSMAFFALVLWHSLELTMRISRIGQLSPGLGLPMWTVYLAAPVGMGLALLRGAQMAWTMLRGQA
jgi:TRAP-type C4-dicarboxylate transport system permease small subunit